MAPRSRQHVVPVTPWKKIAISFAVVVAAVLDDVYTSKKSPLVPLDAAFIPPVQSPGQ